MGSESPKVIPLRPEVDQRRIPTTRTPRRDWLTGAETAAAIGVVIVIGVILLAAVLAWTGGA